MLRSLVIDPSLNVSSSSLTSFQLPQRPKITRDVTNTVIRRSTNRKELKITRIVIKKSFTKILFIKIQIKYLKFLKSYTLSSPLVDAVQFYFNSTFTRPCRSERFYVRLTFWGYRSDITIYQYVERFLLCARSMLFEFWNYRSQGILSKVLYLHGFFKKIVLPHSSYLPKYK